MLPSELWNLYRDGQNACTADERAAVEFLVAHINQQVSGTNYFIDDFLPGKLRIASGAIAFSKWVSYETKVDNILQLLDAAVQNAT